MSNKEIFFTILSCFLVTVVFIAEWYSSKGNLKVVYPMNCLKFGGFLILETSIALNNPEQWAIMIFNLANLWGLAMNIKGLRRLIKKRQEEEGKMLPDV